MIALIAAALIQIADPAPPPVEVASADDCAVIVAIGKAALKWGAKPPGYDFFADARIEGGGTFRETCSWKTLGVADPVPGGPDSKSGFSIGRPSFDATRTNATATLELTVRPQFYELSDCTLQKVGKVWKVMACEERIIT